MVKVIGVFFKLVYATNNSGIISGPDVSEQTCELTTLRSWAHTPVIQVSNLHVGLKKKKSGLLVN